MRPTGLFLALTTLALLTGCRDRDATSQHTPETTKPVTTEVAAETTTISRPNSNPIDEATRRQTVRLIALKVRVDTSLFDDEDAAKELNAAAANWEKQTATGDPAKARIAADRVVLAFRVRAKIWRGVFQIPSDGYPETVKTALGELQSEAIALAQAYEMLAVRIEQRASAPDGFVMDLFLRESRITVTYERLIETMTGLTPYVKPEDAVSRAWLIRDQR
jgi:hypothetical protein